MDVITRQLPILILISFDGFRYDYLSQERTPNLFAISKEASLGHMEAMYVTKTFPNHFSIATGLYEDEHEIINNKMFDPRLNETFRTNTTSSVWWNFKGSNMPIWTANQVISDPDEGRHSASMMYPGTSASFNGVLPTHLRSFDTVRNWTDNVERVIEWMTDAERPANFVAMYFDDPDHQAHMNGPWGEETLNSLAAVDSAAGYLLKRLHDVELDVKTNIIFVSDHGMAEVHRVIYLSDFMDTSSFELHGNTPDWSIFVKPEKLGQKNKIFRQLISLSRRNKFKIYKRSDIPANRHYSKTPRIGDFFLIVDEGYDLFKERPTIPREYPKVWGNHGWEPSSPDMRPLFMAYGPAFKRNYYHAEPFPNIDLFPLMVHILGLPKEELPNNGSLARIFDVLEASDSENEVSDDGSAYMALDSGALDNRIGLTFYLVILIAFYAQFKCKFDACSI